MTEYVPNVPGPAPRTRAEFMRMFNPFRRWGLCLTWQDDDGEWHPTASHPVDWPEHFWWECWCGHDRAE